jgi:hypothetical protein
MTILFECPSCSRRLQLPEVHRGKRTKCPGCGAVSVAPGPPEAEPVAVEPAARRAGPSAGRVPPAGDAAGSDDTIAVPEVGPTCPGCRKVLPPGAVLCVACGHDLRTGKQLGTAHERFEQSWDTGMPIPLRVALLLILEFFCIVVGVLLLSVDACSGLCLIFAGTVFLVLLCGTYIKLHLVRTSKGKVLLTRTWCLCFMPALRRQVNVRNYDRILIDATGTNWTPVLILILLLVAGGIPGLIWWRVALAPANFRVYLKKDRRDEEFSLYRSTDDHRMRDIVEALQELSGLPVDRR